MSIAIAQDVPVGVPERQGLTPALAGSLVLHIFIVLAAFYFLVPARYPDRPGSDAISVELLPPQPPKPPDFAVPVSPLSASSALLASPPDIWPSDLPQNNVPGAPTANGGMIKATKLFSASALKNPHNAEAVAALGTLAASERIEQICDYEGMEQIAAADKRFKPDLLVAYAMANVRWQGGVIKADGAAFRSAGRWYNLKFECKTGGEPAAVKGFAFEVGAEIPRSDWAEHYLVAGNDDD